MNKASTQRWQLLDPVARLLLYPTENYRAECAYLREVLQEGSKAEVGAVLETLDILESSAPHELEERYTQTFDLNPVCTLEVGCHLYGEQYERGRFLVRTRNLLRSVGVDEGGELPDHLPSLLRSLPLLEDDAALDLAACLVPAIRRMCAALEARSDTDQSPRTSDDTPDAPEIEPPSETVRDDARAYLPILRFACALLEEGVPAEMIETTEQRYRPHIRAPKQMEGTVAKGIDLVKLGRKNPVHGLTRPPIKSEEQTNGEPPR